MNLLYYPNDILTTKCEVVTEFNDDLKKQLDAMWDRIKDNNKAMALAAPQVGISKRFFVMKDLKGRRWDIINPEIQEFRDEIVGQEGCLSFPNIFILKSRPTYVKIEYTLPINEKSVFVAMDLEARCVMHEIDHLDGILLTSSVNRQQRRDIER